ncbi:conserved membrane protein of unknown function [Nitrospira japonica]|uniref:TMEM205-like domain-containing protein n=1 Tax=Nitrospira japonica TaxID=1325564 RepID=A0A1W1I2S1_9BACT|nr:DUF4149 domain-containing protein [Nitrospira japonica]SLM47271.1 conserved membrane protein of unknown function [Nitrospira japonica]
MSIAWLPLISLHILAAVLWIGGMLFLSLILAPLLRQTHDPSSFRLLFSAAARRFRSMVRLAIVILLGTGPLLLEIRGLSIMDPSTWPSVLLVKLTLVGLLLLFTLLHDLVLGPRVLRIGSQPVATRTAQDLFLLSVSRVVPRLALLIALAVLVAAAILARSI